MSFSPPLIIDLDGTLIKTDMLHESALRALRDRPGSVLCVPKWLAQGKAVLKQRLASSLVFDPAVSYTHLTLPTILLV